MSKVMVMIANEQTSKNSVKTAIETAKEFNKLHNCEMFTVQETRPDCVVIHMETECSIHPYMMCSFFGSAYQLNKRINDL
jgi:hypothetical protein